MSQKRQTNIELLRIFAMMCIIAHHYAYHGGIYDCGVTGWNGVLSAAFVSVGKLGVNLFIMITGYFMIHSEFRLIRMIRLELAVLFYSITAYLLAVLVFHTDTWNYISIRNTILPSLTNLGTQYWFIPCYFAVLLLSPFINKMLSCLSRQQYTILLGIMFFGVCFAPTFFQTTGWFDGNISLFVFMYLLGGYIREYQVSFCAGRNHWLFWLGMGWYVTGVAVIYLGKVHAEQLTTYGVNTDYLYFGTSVWTVVLSVLIFLFFKQIKMKDNRLIDEVAKTTIGIYLIHDNVYIRQYAWHNIFKTDLFYTSPYLILHVVACVVFIFVVCALIEWIRSHCMVGMVNRIADSRWVKKVDRVMEMGR